ncbi:TetR/AcrR family transcriptional regulator [Stappia sp. F7233]|uniref:TetR/AcrR family transcriptional regulator n=1 Tax=Stappia albiluteola TaxID=2758565 RepID=A0A839AHQ4_9HYPH|nr:TetR/AcrR family transcriptional regulator [Stappia albiluteola]MBA5778442.1 TetR/AcrR family transcriptional regulator [Stappia albiluteola]
MARPRTFAPDAALARIKDAFWEKGYEGTSMQDIEAATGLKKQSLYRLFGDKRQMYLAALRHYEENEIRKAAELLETPGTAKERFAGFFGHFIDDALKTGDRRGCFLCNAAVDQAQVDKETLRQVHRIMEQVARLFERVLATSKPYDTDAELTTKKAAHLMASYLGLRVLIKAGWPEDYLRLSARAAVEAV